MKNRFEELCGSAANDGAFSLAGLATPPAGGEADAAVDELLDAWFKERTDRIECSLALDQAFRWISGVLGAEELTPRQRREGRQVLRSIRVLQKRNRGQ
jgi:hypothetical protein